MRCRLVAAGFEVDYSIQQLSVSHGNLGAEWVEFFRFIHKSLQVRSLGLMRMAEYILDLRIKNNWRLHPFPVQGGRYILFKGGSEPC